MWWKPQIHSSVVKEWGSLHKLYQQICQQLLHRCSLQLFHKLFTTGLCALSSSLPSSETLPFLWSWLGTINTCLSDFYISSPRYNFMSLSHTENSWLFSQIQTTGEMAVREEKKCSEIIYNCFFSTSIIQGAGESAFPWNYFTVKEGALPQPGSCLLLPLLFGICMLKLSCRVGYYL